MAHGQIRGSAMLHSDPAVGQKMRARLLHLLVVVPQASNISHQDLSDDPVLTVLQRSDGKQYQHRSDFHAGNLSNCFLLLVLWKSGLRTSHREIVHVDP
jgi:hypothetical protein